METPMAVQVKRESNDFNCIYTKKESIQYTKSIDSGTFQKINGRKAY